MSFSKVHIVLCETKCTLFLYTRCFLTSSCKEPHISILIGELVFITDDPAQYLPSNFQQIANQSKTPRGIKNTWKDLSKATQCAGKNPVDFKGRAEGNK